MIHSIFHMSYVTYNLSIICELHIPYVICLHVFLFLSATTLQQHCAHTGTKTCVQLLAAGTKTCVQLLACMPTQYIKHQTWLSNYKSYANSILQQTWYACIFPLFWGLKLLFVCKQLLVTWRLQTWRIQTWRLQTWRIETWRSQGRKDASSCWPLCLSPCSKDPRIPSRCIPHPTITTLESLRSRGSCECSPWQSNYLHHRFRAVFLAPLLG